MKDGNEYCGGTERGLAFLQNEAAWIPHSFIGYLRRPGGTYVCVYNFLWIGTLNHQMFFSKIIKCLFQRKSIYVVCIIDSVQSQKYFCYQQECIIYINKIVTEM